MPGGHYEPFLGGHENAVEAELSFLLGISLNPLLANSSSGGIEESAPRPTERA
jgi:hypothetical protein